MRVSGYKLRGYDASYEETLFDVKTGYNSQKNRVLEVTDVQSGVTYIFEFNEKKPEQDLRKKHPCKI